ncbi:MAG: tetratricopeptide repeat protein [Lewinellaceae bacterium]|nr:tetratricopeptide repeat protein [Lewinellaceae bacterium]
MEDNYARYEEIESYLEGQLDANAREAFEERMKAEPDLARELELHRELGQALSEQKALALEGALLSIREERQIQQPQARVRSLPTRLRLIAAAISFLALAGLAYLFWPTGESALVAAYYEPYPLYLNTRSASEGEATWREQLEAATVQYQSGNYAAALPAFQALITSTDQNAPYHFYAGICQLELGRPLEASIHLKEAAGQQDAQFLQPATWYLALAYLQQDRKRDARILLESIEREGGDYSQPAGQLLKELD